MDIDGPKSYVEGTVSAAQLDEDMYVDADADVIVSDAAGDTLGTYTAADSGLTMVRESVARAVADTEDGAAAAYEALDGGESVQVAIIADEDGLADFATDAVDEYLRIDGVRPAQDVMDHDYVDGVCNCCGEEMDIMQADPDKEDLDVYLYDCDSCENDGYYFGGEPAEDGTVSVWSEFTGRDDLRREIDLREGAEVTVYDVDTADDPETVDDESVLYELELGHDWTTRPDGLLERVKDQPVMLSDTLEDAVERHKADPNFGVYITDRTGGSDIEHRDGDPYVKVVDQSSVRFGGAPH